jgi:hypothetical protein
VIEEARELHRLLHPIGRRLAMAAAARLLARAVIASASVLLGWALITAVVPLPFPLLRLVPAVTAALLVGAALAVRWRWPPILTAARIADGRAGLADRLGTAVDLLAQGRRLEGLRALQIRDALSAASRLEARVVAPVRVPKETWPALALCLALAAWGRFGAGFVVPGTPAGRMAAAIHREGRALVDLGRRLDETGRAGRLPETLRTAPAVRQAGRRLEAPRVGWDEALGQVRDVARQLQAAQDTVRRRIDEAMRGGRADRPNAGTPNAGRSGAPPNDEAQRLEAARLALQDLASALGPGAGMSGEELARRLRALSESLDQMGAPPGVRAGVDRARRAAENGQRGASASAMADALQELQGLERMLGDEQALGDAKRQVQQSAERIAQQARGGGSAQSAPQGPPDDSRPSAAGPNPPAPGGEDAAAPPPGTNQGSLAGRGTGGTLGAPTPRLGGTRTQSRLEGLPNPGTTQVREIVGPGRAAPAERPAGRPPADVAHEIDRALAHDPLPPSYLTLVRRYFETVGGTP